eukprot:GHVQ01010377.1.p1 GENE.GHVQ01010377.1~~GHVQ01010377.1.p1  ORF type:complete len:344 (-),score=35.67 GHVQ01010377.1:2134-3165(-)
MLKRPMRTEKLCVTLEISSRVYLFNRISVSRPVTVELVRCLTQTAQALHWAARFNYCAMLQELRKRGAKVGRRNSANETPLEVALIHDSDETAEAIIVGDCDLYDKDSKGNTALHLCARYGKGNLCRAALQRLHEQDGEADIEAKHRNDDGDTPLHVACRQGSSAISALLEKEGFSRNTLNTNGETPEFLQRQYDDKRQATEQEKKATQQQRLLERQKKSGKEPSEIERFLAENALEDVVPIFAKKKITSIDESVLNIDDAQLKKMGMADEHRTKCLQAFEALKKSRLRDKETQQRRQHERRQFRKLLLGSICFGFVALIVAAFLLGLLPLADPTLNDSDKET